MCSEVSESFEKVLYEGDPQSPVRPFVISKQFSKIEQK